MVTSGGSLISTSKRNAAASWAKSRAGDGTKTGDKYNLNFAANANIVTGKVGSNDSKQNCSQLVWAAYKRQDIDFNT